MAIQHPWNTSTSITITQVEFPNPKTFVQKSSNICPTSTQISTSIGFSQTFANWRKMENLITGLDLMKFKGVILLLTSELLSWLRMFCWRMDKMVMLMTGKSIIKHSGMPLYRKISLQIHKRIHNPSLPVRPRLDHSGYRHLVQCSRSFMWSSWTEKLHHQFPIQIRSIDSFESLWPRSGSQVHQFRIQCLGWRWCASVYLSQ